MVGRRSFPFKFAHFHGGTLRALGFGRVHVVTCSNANWRGNVMTFYDHVSHIDLKMQFVNTKILSTFVLKTICLDFSQTNIFVLGTTSSLHDRLVKPQGLRWSPWIQRHAMSSKTWWTTSAWEAKQKNVEQSQGVDAFLLGKKMGNGLITWHTSIYIYIYIVFGG